MKLRFTRLEPAEWAALIPFSVFCFVYPFALALLSFGWMPFGMEWMSSLLLVMLGLAAAGWLWLNFGGVGGLLSAVIFSVGVALEYIGVTTGVPFGRYAYTGVLVPELPGGVPLAIGFAWLLIVVSSFFTARWLLRDKVQSPKSLIPDFGLWTLDFGLLSSIVGATLAVGLDLLLEPVAYHVKGYWLWLDGDGGYYGVPWSNFAAWFAAVMCLCWLLDTLTSRQWPVASYRKAALSTQHSTLNTQRRGWLPIALYSMNVLLFGVVNLAHGFWIPAVIGLLLIMLVLYSPKSKV